MLYKVDYFSLLGKLTLISDGVYLKYILFKKDRFYEKIKGKAIYNENLEIFKETKKWLDKYFNKEKPNIDSLKLKPEGTKFEIKVWNELKKIPYEIAISYSDIAKKLNTHPRAIAKAISHNPIPIIIPCHRVISKDKKLTGYSGGIDKKEKLLKLENYKNRCSWCNLNNPLYIKYHDEEWGVPTHDDKKLFELLILESFQAGLSWECILNKRENFRKAFDNFDIDKIIKYDENKIKKLKDNKGIIRNELKIKATIKNAKIFKEIQKEYGTFDKYIWHFTDYKVIHEKHRTSSKLSDKISNNLNKKGMSFVGTTIIYAYLEAIGLLNTHEKSCFKGGHYESNR